MCPPPFVILYASLAAALVAFAIFAIASHLGYRRYEYHIKVWFYAQGMQWLKKDHDCPGQIDAYLAFDDKDIDLMKQHILPGFKNLEKDGYSIYFPQKNSIAGEFKFQQDTRMASYSKRIIFLLSQNYIENQEGMALFRAMHAMCLKEQMYRIILVFLTDIPELSDVELSTAVKATKCPRYGEKLFWDMIRFAMPKIPKNSPQNEVLELFDVSEDAPLLRGEPESHCEDGSNSVHQASTIRETAFVVDDNNRHVKQSRGEKVSGRSKCILASTNPKICDGRNKEDDDDILLPLDEPGSQSEDDSRGVHGPLGQNGYLKREGHNMQATPSNGEHIYGRSKDFNDSRLVFLGDPPGSQSLNQFRNIQKPTVRPNPFLVHDHILHVTSTDQQILDGRNVEVDNDMPLLLPVEPGSKSQDSNRNTQPPTLWKNDFLANDRNRHIKHN